MIKGLTRKLNEAGKIKIGMKGAMITSSKGTEFRPPVKLDHFIITTTEKDDNGDLVEDTNLMDEIKLQDDAMVNKDKNIVGIPIRLLYDDTELNFPTRMACYDKGILSCVGDGETATKRLDDFKKEWPCPCAKSDPTYTGNDKCKPNGTLTCVIDAAGLFGQAHKFRTTSINSIQGIIGGIELIKLATKGKISGLPLILTLNNKTTSIPGTGTQTKIQVASICYRGNMSDLQQKCLQIASENAQFMIEMNKLEEDARKTGALVVVPEDEDRDFQEEFYPNSVVDIAPVQKEEPGTVKQGESNQGPEANKTDQEDTGSVITKEDPVKLALLNRLKSEKDPQTAIKLLPRLDKAYLIKYIVDMYPHQHLVPDYKENKPIFVGFITHFIGSPSWMEVMGIQKQEEPAQTEQPVSDEHPLISELKAMTVQGDIVEAIRKRFPTPINGTLPPSQLIDLAEKLLKQPSEPVAVHETPENETQPDLSLTDETQTEEFESEVEPGIDHFKWDDGGPVVESQMAQIANLKKERKITDQSVWVGMVGKYKDMSGNPLPLAAKMTKKQADHFINQLDEVPF